MSAPHNESQSPSKKGRALDEIKKILVLAYCAVFFFGGVLVERFSRGERTTAIIDYAAIGGLALAFVFVLARAIKELERRQQLVDELRRCALVAQVTEHAVVITDRDRNITWVNQSFEQLSGFSKKQATGKTLDALLLDRTPTGDGVRQLLASDPEQGKPAEGLFENKHGRDIWLRYESQPILNDAGEVIGFIGLQTDITPEIELRAELRDIKEQLGFAIKEADLGTWEWIPETDRTQFNDRWWTMLGYEPSDLPSTGETWQSLVHPEDKVNFVGKLNRHAEGRGTPLSVEVRLRRKDGSWTPVFIAGQAMSRNEDGKATRIVGIQADLSGRVVAESRAGEAQARLDLVSAGTCDGIWEWDFAEGRPFLTSRFAELVGRQPQELNGWKPVMKLVEREFWPTFFSALRGHLFRREVFDIEVRLKHGEEGARWFQVRGQAAWDAEGRPVRLAGSIADIHDRKLMESELAATAQVDQLTGLANRWMLTDRIQLAIDRERQHAEQGFAVISLTFDRYRQIQDEMGEAASDALLTVIASRLRREIRGGVRGDLERSSLISRIDGHEFVILLDIADREAAGRVVERIRRVLSQPIAIEGKSIEGGVSVGVVASEGKYDFAEDVLRDVEVARLQAVELGGNRCILFDSEMSYRLAEKFNTEAELCKAVAEGQFQLDYQPIVSLNNGQIVGAEALVRWNHPTQGLILTDDFLPIAEESDLIYPIGEWVIREAFSQQRRWSQSLMAKDIPLLHINLSVKHLLAPGFMEFIRAEVASSGIDPAGVQWEVKESALVAELDAARPILKELSEMNFGIAIDDFGTSLACLNQLPIGAIKIDRSFVDTLNKGPEHLGLINAIMLIAWNMNIKVIAEGVETSSQVTALQGLRCGFAQGFYFGNPVQPSDFFRQDTTKQAA